MIPKGLRDRLGLRGGEPQEITERDVRIEMAPAATPMRLVEDEDGLHAVTDEHLGTLTDDDVGAAVEQSRR